MEPESTIISSSTISNVKDLARSLAPTDNDGYSIEIEVRFGIFKDGKFISGVSRSTFNRVKNSILKLNPRCIYIHSEDKIFQNQDDEGVSERYTTVYDYMGHVEDTHRMIKTRVQNFDVHDYSFRISVSKEMTDTTLPPNIQPLLIREKKRWSVELYEKKSRIDMTEVTTYDPSDPSKAKTVFEIEIEILAPKLENLDFFADAIIVFLKEIQGTIIIYTSTEKANIITRINDLIGANRNLSDFIDNNAIIQPRNLKVRDLAVGEILPTTNRSVRYTVTIKAHGNHRLLLIDNLGIYLAYSDQVNKIADVRVSAKLASWHGTVFDCEHIPLENIEPDADSKYKEALIYVAIFDVISTSRRSGIWNEDHPVRMEWAQKFMLTMQKSKGIYIFEPKVFHPFSNVAQFYEAVNAVLLGNYPFKTDGCIFTPDNYKYDPSVNLIKDPSQRILSRQPDIMKWKPPSELTIDFAIFHKLTADGNYIELYVSDGKKLVPFAGTPFDPMKDIMIVPEIQNAPNGTIAEFRWTSEDVDAAEDTQGKFMFVRFRDEKPFPNRQEVAIDVWNDIHSPIDEETIKGEKFKLSFNYHTREKWTLFNMVGKALPQAKIRVLLDIGSGRGGDVRKWAANGFTHIICVEPNEKNRLELERRLVALNKGRKVSLKYLIIPTIGQDWENIARNIQQFSPTGFVDAVSCMLSLSFFFDSPQSTKSIVWLIYTVLVHGGYFFALSIDGQYVLEYFTNPANFIEKNGVRTSNMKMIDFQLRSATSEIDRNHIFIDIPNSIVTNQIEYLTNLSELQTLLTQIPAPLILVDQWRTDKEVFLLTEEIQYVRLFSAFVMRRS
jgi:hypothetical protein